MIYGTITGSTSTISQTFRIFIASECGITTIISSTINNLYITAPNSAYPGFDTIATINWGTSIATCTTPITYTVTYTLVTATPQMTTLDIPSGTTLPLVLGAKIATVQIALEQISITVSG